MKKVLIKSALWVSVFALAAFATVWAASVKIGVIDTQQVLRDSKAAKHARDILLEDLKEKRGLFNRKQDEVRLLEEELKVKGEKMEETERREKTDLLSKEIKNLQRLKTDLEEELNKKNVELTQKILEDVGEIIKDFKKKEKFTLILEKKTVVTHDDGIDITGDIIKLYDSKKK